MYDQDQDDVDMPDVHGCRDQELGEHASRHDEGTDTAPSHVGVKPRPDSPVQVKRCPWVDPADPLYVAYHDTEWGVPVRDDRIHFEFLVLEGAQAGLSWRTVLRKREGYRRAFGGFEAARIAQFGPAEVAALLGDAGIVRNRQKIESAINNAGRFLAIQAEFGSFSAYVWRYVDGRPKVNELRTLADYPATSVESDALSRDLKRRGFSFVGSTIVYAHMQATGLVNDHSLDCYRRDQILALHAPGRS